MYCDLWSLSMSLFPVEICGKIKSFLDIYQVAALWWFPVGWYDTGILYFFFHDYHYGQHLDNGWKFLFQSRLTGLWSHSCDFYRQAHVHTQFRLCSTGLLTRVTLSIGSISSSNVVRNLCLRMVGHTMHCMKHICKGCLFLHTTWVLWAPLQWNIT